MARKVETWPHESHVIRLNYISTKTGRQDKLLTDKQAKLNDARKKKERKRDKRRETSKKEKKERKKEKTENKNSNRSISILNNEPNIK